METLIVLVVFAVACALLSFGICQYRKTEAGLWVLVSLFLGPLGVLMTALWAKPQR